MPQLTVNTTTKIVNGLKHVAVYSEAGVYAGWPANHGAWQWGDEFLVGFLRGKWEHAAMHNIVEPYEKVLARSLDGGETWNLEIPDVDFAAKKVKTAPQFSLGEGAIIRVCGRYDHGGDDCHNHGGFYLSTDYGHSWSGAFSFSSIGLTESHVNTSRTRVLGDLVFLSTRLKRHWGTDVVICARHDTRGFQKIGEIEDPDGRVVMPAVARVGGRIVLTARRRGGRRRDGWIDSYRSDDGGVTWLHQGKVGDTGTDNGNPPALIESEGMLFCSFANRTDCQMLIATSSDAGETWSTPIVLRQSEESDIGYPQFFKRSDGKLVCVYYWADRPEDHQSIEATVIEPCLS